MKRNNITAIFTKGYTLSFLLHLLLLILLALIFFRPPITQSWHEFQWISELETPREEPAGKISDARSLASAKPTAGKQQQEANPAIQTVAPLPIPSPLIETPDLDNMQNNPKVNVNPNSGLSSALNQGVSSSSSSGGDSGFALALESGGGDAFFIRQSTPKLTPLMDDEVVVEFRLAQSGAVIMNSVTVISYRQSAHWEALRKEMSYWRFGFKGSYNSQKVYRIRCKFTLN